MNDEGMEGAGDLGRAIRALFTDKPYNFSWVLDGIAASGRPVTKQQVRWLLDQGIRAILSLTEDAIPPIYLEGEDVVYKHIPIKNHAPPTVEQMVEAVEFIDAARREGRTVLVHCSAGLGRTGTIISAYLILKKGYKPDDAIAEVRRVRPGSVEKSQEEALYKLAEQVKNE